MATLGVGTTAFFTPNSSVTINRKKYKVLAEEGNYKVVFNQRAFKQGLEEQLICEHEYFTSRNRLEVQRKLKEKSDPYKQWSITIQPFGVIIMVVGALTSCCGVMVEWAKTFPFGDLTPIMPQLQILGGVTLTVGVLVMAVSHLLYYKNETRLPKTVVNIPSNSPHPTEPNHKLNKMKGGATIAFYSALALFMASVVAFLIGFFNEWALHFPLKIPESARSIASKLSIAGLIISTFTMIVADTIFTWIEKHIKPMRVHPKAGANKTNSAEDMEYSITD